MPRRSIRAWWSEGESWYTAVGLANLVLGASSILIPLTLKSVLHRSVDSLGVLSSLVSVVGVLGSLAWGRLSDAAHRRKPFVVLSYAVSGACLVLMALARSFEDLVVLNMVLNLFWVANASVTVLLVIENRDSSEWETKIGHLNQVGALGWVFGLLLGSAILAVGGRLADEATALRATFALIGVGGVAAAVLAARSVPKGRGQVLEAPAPAPAVSLGSALVDLVRLGPIRRFDARQLGRRIGRIRHRQDLPPGTKTFLLATMVAYFGLGLFGIPLPMLLAERFLLPPSIVFFFFALQNAAVVVAYPWASRRIRESGNLRVHRGALALRLVLFATSASYLALTRRIPPVPILIVTFIVYGLTWSTFQLSGTAITSRFAKTEARGRALGLYNGLAGSGWILAGVGSGYLARWAGYQASFGAAALCLVLALVMLRFVPESGGAAAAGGEEPPSEDRREARNDSAA